jgi:hypothetical protein
MPLYNKNSGYGQGKFLEKDTNGKTFILTSSSGANFQTLSELFTPDPEGQARLYTSWATAIAATVAGRGDKILVSRSFTTAPTQAQIATMLTNGVISEPFGGKSGSNYATHRAPATLPATTKTPYFTVTGKVKVLNIIGEVTTVVQAQANAIKLVSTPTVGAAVDLCTTVESNAASVGSLFTITGTLANAMIKTVSGAVPSQASALIVTAGTIDLNTAATNTGATKWTVIWEPVDPGAMVLAA